MSLTKIISIFFFVIALGLAGYLAWSINFKIEEDARIERHENKVINKLKMIRDAEMAYLANYGSYTGNWDTLVNFIDTGRLYITQRSEEIFTLDYGADSVKVTIDTIGQVSVKDSIFVTKHSVPSLLEGSIESIDVSHGQRVKKGDVLYSVRNANGKVLSMRSPQNATVQSIKGRVGQEVETEEEVVTIAYPRIDNIQNLPYLPDQKQNGNKKFELFAGKIVRGNVVVSVFEAKDTDPVNPARRKRGTEEANPLKVGSRTDVSTAGNWE